MNPDASMLPGPRHDLVNGPFRVIRWNDQVHVSVSARDLAMKNNRPRGIDLIDDAEIRVGSFA